MAGMLASTVGVASASTPVSPTDGTILRETQGVVLRWSLDAARHEESWAIEWAPKPDTYPDGAFSDLYSEVDLDIAPTATTYDFGRPSPGRYYWHVESTICDGPSADCAFLDFTDFIYGPTAFFGVLDVLSIREARRYTRRTIKKEGGRYLNISRLVCHRRGDFKSQCRFLAWIGDISYRGHGFISYSRDLDKNLKYFSTNFRVRFTNHYCLAVRDKPRGKCIKKERW
ncbi:MAG: hypothetical protein ACRDNG_10530 [Gaiellaceae bacterium]